MDQSVLLNEMIENNMNSILIKVCTIGLNIEDLMKSLKEMKDKLISLNMELMFVEKVVNMKV